MHSRERIVCIDRVIELGVEPVGRRVTCSAIVGQAELHMRRVSARSVVAGVTGIAGRRSPCKYIVGMARRAGQCCVRSGQRVASNLQMVKLRIEPCVHAVTGFARGRESRRNMIQNLGLEILLVAGIARCRKSGELAHRRVLVAIVALQHRVRTNQREAVLVIANLRKRSLPSPHRVAALAVGAELTAMDIGMAISASRAHILEHQAHMAFGARHLGVHAA